MSAMHQHLRQRPWAGGGREREKRERERRETIGYEPFKREVDLARGGESAGAERAGGAVGGLPRLPFHCVQQRRDVPMHRMPLGFDPFLPVFCMTLKPRVE